MRDWTRRQFGLWSTAMALAPAAFAADEAPAPLASLTLHAVLVRDESHEAHYELRGRHEGPAGLSIGLALTEVRSTPPIERPLGLAWLDGAHPLSRRVEPPPFVDLPAGKEMVLATITMGARQEERTQAMRLHLTVRVWEAASGDAREIGLPPLPVRTPAPQG